MIPGIIFGVIGFIVSYIIFKDALYVWPNVFIFTFASASAGVIVSIAITLFAPVECVNPYSYPLQNLSDNTTSNKFYLGIGNGNASDLLTYFYYIQEGDGSISGYSIRSGLAKIYEDTETQPTVTFYQVEVDTKFRWATITPNISRNDCPVDFHIPPRSILPDYKLGG